MWALPPVAAGRHQSYPVAGDPAGRTVPAAHVCGGSSVPSLRQRELNDWTTREDRARSQSEKRRNNELMYPTGESRVLQLVLEWQEVTNIFSVFSEVKGTG